MKRTAHTAASGTVLSARTLFGERLSPLAPIELCQHAPRPDTLPDRASLERV